MDRKYEAKTRGEIFVEYVVWNAAAGAAVAVMILVLLVSLKWLDHVSPSDVAEIAPPTAVEVARPAVAAKRADPVEQPATELAAINRPSG